MEALENIVLELLLEALLVIELFSQVSHLISQALLSHSKIINDQSKILVNTIKMLKLLSHLVCLFIELLDLNFTGSNVTLKFLNLVIEHELELLKLLCFLLQIVDSLILVTDGSFSLLDLTLLRVDLLAKRVSLLNKISELLLLLMNIFLSLLLLRLCLLVVVCHQCQLSFALHSSVDDLRQLFLILLLNAINIFPSLIFNVLPLLLMLCHQLLAGLSQSSSLALLLL
jgi:hypothetical protein